MKVKEMVTEFNEKHPVLASNLKVINRVMIVGVGVCVLKNLGVNIDIRTDSEIAHEEKVHGDIRELENAVKGIEARGFDSSATLQKIEDLRATL